MTTQTIQVAHKEIAETELRSIRQNCGKWAVNDNIKSMRNQLGLGGLTLGDIGTCEEELESCFKTGHVKSAQNWLQVAKDYYRGRDVSFEIERIRSRLAEADLTLSDIGSSETELIELLWASRTARKSDYARTNVNRT